MEYLIIDAHAHLWERQNTTVDDQPIYSLQDNPSRSMFFGEEVQMLPPFMIDGRNTAEVFISNMDYAQVSAAVIVQEVIDGNQDQYLAKVQKQYPNRFLCCGLMTGVITPGTSLQFEAYAMPGHRITTPLNSDEMMKTFKLLEQEGKYLDMCLADDERQIKQFDEVLTECPRLKVAIGHFGMVTTPNWKNQIMLARHPNVMIESGGITWLYNSEFYPYPSAVRSILEASDMVGIEKLMWGSDYPRTITAITYKMSYDFICKSDVMTTEQKSLFLGRNAERFYGLRDLVSLPYIKNMSE